MQPVRATRMMAVLFTAALLVAACGSDSKPAATGSGSSASAQHRSITVLQTAHSLTFLPLYVAKRLKYFDDVNLDVEIGDATGDGAANTAALVNGDGWALVTGAEQAFLSQNKGIDLRAIVTMASSTPMALVAGRNYVSSGKLADDLRGKKIALSGVGAPPHATGLEILQSLGLDPEHDVTLVEGSDSARVAALKSGEADFAFLTQPSIEKVLRSGTASKIVLVGSDVVGDYAAASVMVLGKELDGDPSTATRFVTAITRAGRLIADHPDQALEVAKAEFSDVDADVIRAAFDYYVEHKLFSADGKISDRSAATVKKYAANMAQLSESDLDSTKAIDHRFGG